MNLIQNQQCKDCLFYYILILFVFLIKYHNNDKFVTYDLIESYR